MEDTIFLEEENMHQKAINFIKNIKVSYIDTYHPHTKGTKDEFVVFLASKGIKVK